MKIFYKKLNLALLIILIGTQLVNAQKKNTWKNKLYGFIRADAFYDSRKSAEAVDGMFLLYPLKPHFDSNGKDINDIDGITMTSISSRVGLKSNDIKIFDGNAILNSKLEADFTARSNSNSLRLRQAYISLKWDKSYLLIGRTWHPMFTPEAFPHTLSINVGTPFNPFNRSPQIRYQYTPNNRIKIISALIYQNDYANLGYIDNKIDKDRNMIRYSKIPNIHIQPQLTFDNLLVGAAFDFKTLQPRNSTTGTLGTFKTQEKISSYSLMGFAKYKKGLFKIKAKTIYGQNLTDHLLTGGYAVSKIDTLTGHECYTPSNNILSYINIEYGNKILVGVFGGYNKNLGYDKNIVQGQNIYARGADIDHIYRASSYVRYKIKKLEFWFETEYTAAAYGDIDYNNFGKVINSKETGNLRLQFSCIFNI